jgi:DNA-binding NtrC family response regulator
MESRVDRPGSMKPGTMTTILIVDDEPGIVLVMSKVLEYRKFKVFTATSGSEALQIFENHGKEIDLAIIDLWMPDMGGVELAEALRLSRPDLNILLMSGSGMSIVEGMLASPGKQYPFLPKPFLADGLILAIEDVLLKEG